MMGDLINLRRARKSKLREEKSEQSALNRAKFGRTLTEINHQKKLAERDKKSLDAHFIESPLDKE